MNNFLLLFVMLLTTSATAQITVSRIKYQIETSAPRENELTLRRGETVDLQAQFLSYGSAMDIAGATVTLHATTNGMPSGTSFQVSGTAGSNGIASVRIRTDEWLPYSLTAGTWTLECSRSATSRIMRARGVLKLAGIHYPTTNSPLPITWSTNFWTAISGLQSRTNDWNSAFGWGDHSVAGYLLFSSWLSWLSTNTYVKAESDPAVAAMSAATKEITGFDDPSAVELLYNRDIRKVTVFQIGGVKIWWRGSLVTLPNIWTSEAHADAQGKYYLAMRNSTNIVWSTDSWTFDMAQVAYVNYTSSSDAIGFREAHGLMQWQVHEAEHRTVGCYRYSGLGPIDGTYETLKSSNAANTPSFSAGIIKDEDNPTPIAELEQEAYTLMTITNSTTVLFHTNQAALVLFGSPYPLINENASNLTETVTARYFNVWQIAMPVTIDVNSQVYRMVFLQPQVVHTTLEAAQGEDFRGLNLGNFSAFGPEFIAFTKLTFRTAASYASTGKMRIEAIGYLSGSQASQTLITQLTQIDHSSTLNRDAADAHPTIAITGLDAALAAIPPSVLTNQLWGAAGTNATYQLSWDVTNGTFKVLEVLP